MSYRESMVSAADNGFWSGLPLAKYPEGVTDELILATKRFHYAPSDDMWVSVDNVWFHPREMMFEVLK